VGLAVREEVVDNHADDGEEEYDEGPEDLVRYGALRLEDLNCNRCVSLVPVVIQLRLLRGEGKGLTPCDDVENQDDEPNDTAAGTCLPRLR
jgi:hypothetical protein